MIGLKYVCIISDIKFKEIGEELGVSKQTVNSWISESRNIPEKYLDILSKKFRLEKSYLEKNVDEIDKLRIRNIMLKQQMDAVYLNSEDDDGNEYIQRIEDPYNIQEDIKLNNIKVEGMEILKKIRLHLLGCNKELESNMGEEIERMKECIAIYSDIASIIDSPNINRNGFRDIIDTILKLYNIKSEFKVDDTNWAFKV